MTSAFSTLRAVFCSVEQKEHASKREKCRACEAFSDNFVFAVHTKKTDLCFQKSSLFCSCLAERFRKPPFSSIHISVFDRFSVDGRQKRILIELIKKCAFSNKYALVWTGPKRTRDNYTTLTSLSVLGLQSKAVFT